MGVACLKYDSEWCVSPPAKNSVDLTGALSPFPATAYNTARTPTPTHTTHTTTHTHTHTHKHTHTPKDKARGVKREERKSVTEVSHSNRDRGHFTVLCHSFS